MTPGKIVENVTRLWEHSESLTPDDKMHTINALVELVGEMHGALDIAISFTHEALADKAHNQNKKTLTKAAPIAELARKV